MTAIILILIYMALVTLTVKKTMQMINPKFSIISIIQELISEDTTPPTIKTAEVYKPTGFIFGQKKQGAEFIVKKEREQGHIMIVGGSGSGKTSCLIIPTFLTWKGQILAIDIKGELKAKTSTIRKNYKYFDPTDDNAWGYDPLYMVRNSKNPNEEISEIVHTLIQKPLDSKSDPFWIESARSLLNGFILYLHNLDNNITFPQIVSEILKTSTAELINEIMDVDSTDEDAKTYISAFCNMNPQTLGSIDLEMRNKIRVFNDDKSLFKALSKTKILTPYDIDNGTDIYLIIEQRKLDTWGYLFNLIISQFLKYCSNRTDIRNEKINTYSPLLFILDEFANMGKINKISTSLSMVMSKGVTICIVVQSIAQLDGLYGIYARREMCNNCGYKAILKVSDTEEQKYFSDMVGTQEVRNVNIIKNADGTSRKMVLGNNTREIPIIKPSEFSYFDEMLLLFTPKGHTFVQKTPYYKHPIFKKSFLNLKDKTPN